MALINCKECGKEISNTCKTCVHCGAKTETSKTNNKKLIRNISILIVFVLLIGFVFIFYNNTSKAKLCNKSINILEKYKRDEIDTLKLIEELKALSDEASTLSKKETKTVNQLNLSTLSTKLYLISNDISNTYYHLNQHNDTSDIQIDKYIKEIKELKY